MESDFKTYLAEVKQLTTLIFEENFQLSDIGLSSKIAFDWSKSGVYLKERKSKYRRKYNGIEYVWLRLVKELREFGLPIKSILNLKNHLLTEIDLLAHYTNLFDELEIQDKYWKGFLKDMEKAFESPENLIEAVNQEQKKINLSNTKLSVLILSTILSKSNVHLAIAKDGNCIVFDESPMQDLFTSSMIIGQPYINIPLNHIIAEFMGREDLYELDLMDDGIKLTEAENKIITLLRKGGINSLHVKFVDGIVNIIETEETIDIKDAKGRLIDLIQNGSYQEISYKTVKGKIVNLKRKTKHK